MRPYSLPVHVCHHPRVKSLRNNSPLRAVLAAAIRKAKSNTGYKPGISSQRGGSACRAMQSVQESQLGVRLKFWQVTFNPIIGTLGKGPGTECFIQPLPYSRKPVMVQTRCSAQCCQGGIHHPFMRHPRHQVVGQHAVGVASRPSQFTNYIASDYIGLCFDCFVALTLTCTQHELCICPDGGNTSSSPQTF